MPAFLKASAIMAVHGLHGLSDRLDNKMPIRREPLIPLYIKSRCTYWALRGLCAAGIKTVSHHLAGGGQMLLDTNDRLARRIRCEEAFEPAVRREMERIASRGVNVIDIGANIGYYTILTSKLIGPGKRVFSFEPQPAVVTKLRRNMEASGLANVTVFPFALSDASGRVPFHVPHKGGESHGSLHANGRFRVMKIVDVETRRLDDVWQQLGSPILASLRWTLKAPNCRFSAGPWGCCPQRTGPSWSSKPVKITVNPLVTVFSICCTMFEVSDIGFDSLTSTIG